MTSSKRISNLISLINKNLKIHRQERDPDGFFTCYVQELCNTEVAPKGEYLGTESERLKEYEELEEGRDKAECDYCNLCEELIKKLSKLV